MKTKSQILARQLLKKLQVYEPFIYTVSRDKHSVYVHFAKLPQGITHKLRVSNHPERERYGYKWQLRTDGVPPVSEHKPYSRYFDKVDDLVAAFVSYYNKVENNMKEQA